MSETASLWTLFVSSFLAATLLPGGSEAVLFAILKAHPTLQWPALAAATIGNSLGGMSSYLIGRIIPQRGEPKRLDAVRRHGSPILLFSWVPVIGDAFCVAAGWLRLNAWTAAAFMAAGKFARYVLVAYLAAPSLAAAVADYRPCVERYLLSCRPWSPDPAGDEAARCSTPHAMQRHSPPREDTTAYTIGPRPPSDFC